MIGGRLLCVDAIDVHGDEGVLADARAAEELGCASSFVTAAVLAAGPAGEVTVHPVSAQTLTRQFEAARSAGAPTAVRTGVLGDADQVRAVARELAGAGSARVVVAPAGRLGGCDLMDARAIEETRAKLFPLARVVALRVGDLARWTGAEARTIDELREGARALREQGARAALVSGLIVDRRVLDVLDDEGRVAVFDTTRLVAPRLGGVSSSHATALGARLAVGARLEAAAAAAQRFVGSRLRRGR